MMQIRNALIGAVALIASLGALFLFATIGLAVIGGVAVAAVAGAIVMAFMPARRVAPGTRNQVHRDKHGIIIDM